MQFNSFCLSCLLDHQNPQPSCSPHWCFSCAILVILNLLFKFLYKFQWGYTCRHPTTSLVVLVAYIVLVVISIQHPRMFKWIRYYYMFTCIKYESNILGICSTCNMCIYIPPFHNIGVITVSNFIIFCLNIS